MGQREEVVGAGAGTVKIGRWLVEDIGWLGLVWFGEIFDDCDVGKGGSGCDADEESDTVFVIARGCEDGFDAISFPGLCDEEGLGGNPEITGGGRSRPSAAFLES